MMMLNKVSAIAVWASATMLCAGPALAAGFAVSEHSAAATGRAGAVVATAGGPSSIFYNPAGLTSVEGTAIRLGSAIIFPNAKYVGNGFADAQPADRAARACADGTGRTCYDLVSSPVPVPNFYAARALSDKAYVGIGVYLPYGLGLEWRDPEDWPGRTVIQKQTLRSIFITPTVALKLSDMVSVAVGVSLVPATVFIRQSIGATDTNELLFPKGDFGGSKDGALELSGSAFGVGASLGLQMTFLDHLKLGATYRSAVGLDFTGDVDFQLPDGVSPSIAASFPDGTMTAELTLPHFVALGLGWDDENFAVELAANMTFWQDVEEIRVNFDTGLPSTSKAEARNWKATPTIRLGGEYRFLGQYAVRLGTGYDMTPVPDETISPSLPDNDRILFSGGFGAAWGPVNVDLSYMGVLVLGRDALASDNFPAGEYPGRVIHLASATLGTDF